MAEGIRRWLEEHGLGKYGDQFGDNDIDFDVLSELEDQELRELGVTIGDRKRLLRAISQIDENGAAPMGDEDLSVSGQRNPGLVSRRRHRRIPGGGTGPAGRRRRWRGGGEGLGLDSDTAVG